MFLFIVSISFLLISLGNYSKPVLKSPDIDLNNVSIPTTPITATKNCDYSEWQKAVKERDAVIQKLSDGNKEWVAAENQWKTDNESLKAANVNLKNAYNSKDKTLKEVANYYQGSINEISDMMVDQNYHNSLYNDLFGMIPQNPIYYTQSLIDINNQIAIRKVYSWATVSCSQLDYLVKLGLIYDRGAKCNLIQTTSKTLEK